MSNWKVVTGDDGQQYVEFSGIIMRAAEQVPEGVLVQLAPPRGGGAARYTVVDGQLPPGMTMDTETGAISGRPVAGPYQATVRVESAGGVEDRQVLLGAPPPSVPSAFDEDRLMNADGVVATFPRPVDGIEAWRAANPSLGVSAPGSGGMPDWLTGLLTVPGAMIGQAPYQYGSSAPPPPGVASVAYNEDALNALKVDAGADWRTLATGYGRRGIDAFTMAIDEAMPSMTVTLWSPDDEPNPPQPQQGRFQNLDFEEMP